MADKDRKTTKQVGRKAEKTLSDSPAEQRDQSNRERPMPKADEQAEVGVNPNRTLGSPVDDHSRDQAVASGDIATPQYQRDHSPRS